MSVPDTSMADEGAIDGTDPNMDAFRAVLEQVPRCLSRESADEASVNFCFIQTKGLHSCHCASAVAKDLVCPTHVSKPKDCEWDFYRHGSCRV